MDLGKLGHPFLLFMIFNLILKKSLITKGLTTQYTSKKYFIDFFIKWEGNIMVPIYIVIDI